MTAQKIGLRASLDRKFARQFCPKRYRGGRMLSTHAGVRFVSFHGFWRNEAHRSTPLDRSRVSLRFVFGAGRGYSGRVRSQLRKRQRSVGVIPDATTVVCAHARRLCAAPLS